MQTYTAFCQQVDGGGTIWIDTVEVASMGEDAMIDAAKLAARTACAGDWEWDFDNVHCLGLAKGDVQIVTWEDIGD